MSVLDWPRRAWNWMRSSSAGGGVLGIGVLPTTLPENIVDRYDVLDAYYENNDLYKKLFAVGLGPGKGVRALGNPTHESVEFFASHLWPESLEELLLEADKEAVKESAEKILEWSNWGEAKQVVARWFPCHGHFFLKAERVEGSERKYIRLMEPRHVTDYAKDPRGFIIMMRLDIPIEENEVKKTHTELWEKSGGKEEDGGQGEGGRYRSWRHVQGPGAKIKDLGTPEEDQPLTAFGSDFVPFVHASFQANGKGRGDSCFAHALEPMGEIDKTTTRSHDMTFVEDPVVLKRGEAGAGAITVEQLASVEGDQGEEVEVGEGERKRKMILLPGLSSAEILTAPIDAAALGLIANQWEVILRKCPELLYFVMQQKGDPSGIALSLKLAPAQDRAKEARYNGETGIIQCLKMCLTMNQAAGIEGFKNIGSFDAGDFDGLKFTDRQILPESDAEKAARVKVELENIEQAIRVFQAAGMDSATLKERLAEVMEVDISEVGEAVPTDVDGANGTAGGRQRALMERLGVTGGNGAGGSNGE